MKLIREFLEGDALEFLTEANEQNEKTFKIKGPFVQAEVRNKNKRRYPKQILEREVSKLNETKIKNKCAWGEIDHPKSPTINLQNASHLIESLVMDGNTGYGTAKIVTKTVAGRTAAALMEAGGRLMTSSRGVGTINEDTHDVNDDYSLITIDLVADASAPGCFVEGILENKEFIIGQDGDIVEAAILNLEKKSEKKFSKELTYMYLKEFINEIRKKYV